MKKYILFISIIFLCLSSIELEAYSDPFGKYVEYPPTNVFEFDFGNVCVGTRTTQITFYMINKSGFHLIIDRNKYYDGWYYDDFFIDFDIPFLADSVYSGGFVRIDYNCKKVGFVSHTLKIPLFEYFTHNLIDTLTVIMTAQGIENDISTLPERINEIQNINISQKYNINITSNSLQDIEITSADIEPELKNVKFNYLNTFPKYLEPYGNELITFTAVSDKELSYKGKLKLVLKSDCFHYFDYSGGYPPIKTNDCIDTVIIPINIEFVDNKLEYTDTRGNTVKSIKHYTTCSEQTIYDTLYVSNTLPYTFVSLDFIQPSSQYNIVKCPKLPYKVNSEDKIQVIVSNTMTSEGVSNNSLVFKMQNGATNEIKFDTIYFQNEFRKTDIHISDTNIVFGTFEVTDENTTKQIEFINQGTLADTLYINLNSIPDYYKLDKNIIVLPANSQKTLDITLIPSKVHKVPNYDTVKLIINNTVCPKEYEVTLYSVVVNNSLDLKYTDAKGNIVEKIKHYATCTNQTSYDTIFIRNKRPYTFRNLKFNDKTSQYNIVKSPTLPLKVNAENKIEIIVSNTMQDEGVVNNALVFDILNDATNEISFDTIYFQHEFRKTDIHISDSNIVFDMYEIGDNNSTKQIEFVNKGTLGDTIYINTSNIPNYYELDNNIIILPANSRKTLNITFNPSKIKDIPNSETTKLIINNTICPKQLEITLYLVGNSNLEYTDAKGNIVKTIKNYTTCTNQTTYDTIYVNNKHPYTFVSLKFLEPSTQYNIVKCPDLPLKVNASNREQIIISNTMTSEGITNNALIFEMRNDEANKIIIDTIYFQHEFRKTEINIKDTNIVFGLFEICDKNNTKQVEIINDGTLDDTLYINENSIPEYYKVDRNIIILPANSRKTFNITFIPSKVHKVPNYDTTKLIINNTICPKQYAINLYSVVDSINIAVNPKSINFDKVWKNHTASREIEIHNNSLFDVYLTQFDIVPNLYFTTDVELPILIQKNNTKIIPIYFSVSEIDVYNSKIYLTIEHSCRQNDSIALMAEAVAENELIFRVSTHDRVLSNLTNYDIPIYLRSTYNALDNITIENIELEMDRTLFYPKKVNTGSMNVELDSNNRIINISDINVNHINTNEEIELCRIRGNVLLGETDSTGIIIRDVKSSTEAIKSIQNGYLTIETCNQGGNRLINYGYSPNVRASNNPVINDIINVECDVVEKGVHSLSIVNYLGKEIVIKEWNIDEKDTKQLFFSIPANNLCSGTYILVLTTPTKKYSTNFVIVR